ncbi:hypothetical protein EDB80DRAFT_163245 [Ilyonectria destructans]|nr:hypothetical protein EDB80DRAFT_163245 [Ilyonectria destructans]
MELSKKSHPQTLNPSTFKFVYLENTGDIRSSAIQKQAKSYAAKQFHARARHEQVKKHQESMRQEARQILFPSPYIVDQSIDADFLNTNAFQPPNPTTMLSAAPTDPFASAARPISSFEYFLISHYIQVILPAGGFYSPSHPSPEAYLHGAITEWIPLAMTDPGMLNGILVPACRNLHSLQGEGQYLEMALRYKVACIVSLNMDLSEQGGKPGDSSIAKAIILAGDEVSIGDLLTGKDHIQAAHQMVASRGGFATLGTNGFLSGLISMFSSEGETEIQALHVLRSYSHFST